MLNYEEKFIVINKKHLKNVPDKVLENFKKAHYTLSKHIHDNKYYVCNQDEPYAKDIIEIILAGKNEKSELQEKMMKEMLESLIKCRDQFKFYSDEHLKKEKSDKAMVNLLYSEDCNKTISKVQNYLSDKDSKN